MGEPANNSQRAPDSLSNGRLDSWKEIAVYLGKSVRTVQRWEKEEALPIHRHAHSDRDSVYAFKPEVDVWRASRSHLLEGHNGHAEVNGAPNPQAFPSKHPAVEVERPGQPRRWLFAVVTAAVVLAAAGLAVFFTRPAPSAQILSYTQLTHDGKYKAGLATDGVWAYFIEQGNAGKDLCKVPLQGGEITCVPLNRPFASSIAVSPDGAKALIGGVVWFNREPNLWVYSTLGKPLHPVGGGVNVPFAWAPAQKVAYARGRAIWTSDEDGSHPVQVANAPDEVYAIGWSPDAKRIWYTTLRPGGSPVSIGEVNADGHSLRRIFEENSRGGALFSGFWSASGANFGFLSVTAQRPELVVTPESWPWNYRSHAVSLAGFSTRGINEFASDSPRNRFLVMAGRLWHDEIFRFDRLKGPFTTYFDGISASDIDFSPDGQSAVYVDDHDGSLWRYELAERRKTRLVGPPFNAVLPRWSPDGQWVAMTAGGQEGGWRIYRLPARGGTPERLIPGDENEGAPTWSPDGKSLVFGKIECALPQKCGVYRYDLATRSLSMLPGSQGLRTARWSPNGKYIAALRLADACLMLFDFSTQRWRVISGPTGGDVLAWSRDSNYIYEYGPKGGNPSIVRVAVLTGAMDQVADLKALDLTGRDVLPWFGLAPDGSPIVVRETGDNELYSVSYKMP
jgi:Tol biopolymer transport system component